MNVQVSFGQRGLDLLHHAQNELSMKIFSQTCKFAAFLEIL